MAQLVPLVTVLMLKDQFCDFTDLNLLTLVRSHGMKLLEMICRFARVSPQLDNPVASEVAVLVQNMPQLLSAC